MTAIICVQHTSWFSELCFYIYAYVIYPELNHIFPFSVGKESRVAFISQSSSIWWAWAKFCSHIWKAFTKIILLIATRHGSESAHFLSKSSLTILRIILGLISLHPFTAIAWRFQAVQSIHLITVAWFSLRIRWCGLWCVLLGALGPWSLRYYRRPLARCSVDVSLKIEHCEVSCCFKWVTDWCKG